MVFWGILAMRLRQFMPLLAMCLLCSMMTGCVCHQNDCSILGHMFGGCGLNRCHGGGETYPGCACGEAYYGDWKSHPPTGQPCDCYGNYTGQKCSSPDCRHLNVRAKSCGCEAGCASGNCGPSCATGDCGCGHQPVVGKMHHIQHKNTGCATCQ